MIWFQRLRLDQDSQAVKWVSYACWCHGTSWNDQHCHKWVSYCVISTCCWTRHCLTWVTEARIVEVATLTEVKVPKSNQAHKVAFHRHHHCGQRMRDYSLLPLHVITAPPVHVHCQFFHCALNFDECFPNPFFHNNFAQPHPLLYLLVLSWEFSRPDWRVSLLSSTET